MNGSLKFLLTALGIIAVLEVLAGVQAAGVTGPAQPPAFAVIGLFVLAAVTVVAIYGLARGLRWARPVIYVTAALRIASAVLGAGNGTDAVREIVGLAGVVLYVAVIVMLVRTRPRRRDLAAQRA